MNRSEFLETPKGRRQILIDRIPSQNSDNEITGIIGFALDVTDLRRAEEEKEKLQAQLMHTHKMQAIGTLAGGIAHDFNNLLSIIQAHVSFMLFDIDSEQPHHENLTGITKQVSRGSKMTQQLLGYARKGKYEVRPIHLNQLVEETLDTFSRTKREITIHRELAEDLSAIEADQGQIEQVLLNLFINSADAMPGGGELFLKTENTTHRHMTKAKAYDPKAENYVLLTVTDTGAGIDEETQKRMFEPFFTTKEMGRGTGLGLASAYGIIQGHSGYIEVDSQKGHGTVFRIYLPASDKKVQKAYKAAEETIRGSETILLVDDEEMFLDAGSMVLKRLGYTVLQANGGRDAVEFYQANNDKINLVILDMIMPQMGGGQVYDRLKEINPLVRVLLSSGYSVEGQAQEILDRGCDGFIQKPFTQDKLSHSIRRVLSKE